MSLSKSHPITRKGRKLKRKKDYIKCPHRKGMVESLETSRMKKELFKVGESRKGLARHLPATQLDLSTHPHPPRGDLILTPFFDYFCPYIGDNILFLVGVG